MKYFQAEVVLLLQDSSKILMLEFKAARGRNTYTLTWLYSMLLEKYFFTFRFLVSFGCKFVMLFYACCTTFSAWHWEGLLVATLPFSSLLSLLSSPTWQPGSIPRHCSKPWKRHLTAIPPPQQGYPLGLQTSLALEHKCLQDGTTPHLCHFIPAPLLLLLSQHPKSSLDVSRQG